MNSNVHARTHKHENMETDRYETFAYDETHSLGWTGKKEGKPQTTGNEGTFQHDFQLQQNIHQHNIPIPIIHMLLCHKDTNITHRLFECPRTTKCKPRHTLLHILHCTPHTTLHTTLHTTHHTLLHILHHGLLHILHCTPHTGVTHEEQ